MPIAVVDRQLSAEEHAQQLQQVRCSWQLAAVLEFLHVFSIHLQLRDSFTPEELEVAIVADTGQNGLLANLHQVRQPAMSCYCWLQAHLGLHLFSVK